MKLKTAAQKMQSPYTQLPLFIAQCSEMYSDVNASECGKEARQKLGISDPEEPPRRTCLILGSGMKQEPVSITNGMSVGP
jgi:hypothetical protein